MELLRELTQTPAVPGREHRLRELIQQRAGHLFDDMRIDAMGSLICTRKPRPRSGKPPATPLKVMLAAHMDQIGFLVKHIDDKGYLRLNAVGGFDTRNLFARICRICPDINDPARDLYGVLNPTGKPIHIANDEERKKVPELAEFFVNTGLSAEQVRKQVRIGDVVVLDGPWQQLGDAVVAQALDNRIACWLLIRAIEQLEQHDCEVYAVFTTQEEVGLRGAGPAAFSIEPDVGIALDTTLCVDSPGVPEDQQVTQFGGGAGLTIMDSASIADLSLLETFERIAIEKDIRHQRSILTRGGTDAGTMQRAGGGLRTFSLSCPVRYIHTVTEMAHRDDLHACRDLLAAYLAQAG